MTPTEILDLAMAYINEPVTKLAGKSLGHRVYVANDLARLTGTTQLDVRTRSKQPALITYLLKNKLVTKDEYVELYKKLIAIQAEYIKTYLKNADPASRRVGGAAARQAYKDMKGNFDESVNEMSRNDVHFKEIMKMYDRGGSFTKKKVAVVVCRNSKASRRDIEEELLDTNYQDIVQYQDELNIKESVEGDRIQKLNDRIKALRDKMNSTKSSTQKNLIQQRLKNALQTLTKIKSGLGIKKINNESVNEAASVEAMGIAALTGLRGDAVQKFIDDNNIHARKLFAFLKMKGPHTLSNRMDISTAIVGKANNKYAQGIIKAFSESKINEANDTYFNSFTDAVSYARKVAEKKGFEIDENDWQSQIALGGKYSRSRPGVGKTNTFTVGLLKGGKPQRKALQISVYGMESGKFELTHYIN
jgi:hypothetical protein